MSPGETDQKRDRDSHPIRYSMPSAKQQPSNIKHSGGIRPNVCTLTFGLPYTIVD